MCLCVRKEPLTHYVNIIFPGEMRGFEKKKYGLDFGGGSVSTERIDGYSRYDRRKGWRKYKFPRFLMVEREG